MRGAGPGGEGGPGRGLREGGGAGGAGVVSGGFEASGARPEAFGPPVRWGLEGYEG